MMNILNHPLDTCIVKCTNIDVLLCVKLNHNRSHIANVPTACTVATPTLVLIAHRRHVPTALTVVKLPTLILITQQGAHHPLRGNVIYTCPHRSPTYLLYR